MPDSVIEKTVQSTAILKSFHVGHTPERNPITEASGVQKDPLFSKART